MAIPTWFGTRRSQVRILPLIQKISGSGIWGRQSLIVPIWNPFISDFAEEDIIWFECSSSGKDPRVERVTLVRIQYIHNFALLAQPGQSSSLIRRRS